jgi:hypothetical protein
MVVKLVMEIDPEGVLDDVLDQGSGTDDRGFELWVVLVVPDGPDIAWLCADRQQKGRGEGRGKEARKRGEGRGRWLTLFEDKAYRAAMLKRGWRDRQNKRQISNGQVDGQVCRCG